MQQVLVYGDSLTWGIVPDTRKRWPFTTRWPGVMERTLIAAGHDVRVIEDCLNGRRTVWDEAVAKGHACDFFDAGTVTPTSRVDGVHLDADQHERLGKAMAEVVGPLILSG